MLHAALLLLLLGGILLDSDSTDQNSVQPSYTAVVSKKNAKKRGRGEGHLSAVLEALLMAASA
jgi:hypothetical protein